MTNIDFTDSAQLNDKFIYNTRVFRFMSDKWRLIKFQGADDGAIDAGGPEPIRSSVSLGAASSDFGSIKSFDCGGV